MQGSFKEGLNKQYLEKESKGEDKMKGRVIRHQRSNEHKRKDYLKCMRSMEDN